MFSLAGVKRSMVDALDFLSDNMLLMVVEGVGFLGVVVANGQIRLVEGLAMVPEVDEG